MRDCDCCVDALMLAGCTQTKIQTPTWSMERVTFLQRTDVPKITVLDDGSIERADVRSRRGHAPRFLNIRT